jgi:hypothetical protein
VQGGEDDLTSGLVYEANGTTTLMFRHISAHCSDIAM